MGGRLALSPCGRHILGTDPVLDPIVACYQTRVAATAKEEAHQQSPSIASQYDKGDASLLVMERNIY